MPHSYVPIAVTRILGAWVCARVLCLCVRVSDSVRAADLFILFMLIFFLKTSFLAAAYPYYTGAFSMLAGLFVFSVFFMFTKESAKKK